MFCSNCGKELKENANFCSYCGSKKGLEKQTSEPIQNNVQNQASYTENKATTATSHAQSAVMAMADEKYCFYCGSVIKKIAQICMKCGVNQNKRSSTSAIDVYCTSCGKTIKKEALSCPFCGVTQELGTKSWITTLLLIIFTGVGHRFYVGKIGSAILMLLLILSPSFFWGVAVVLEAMPLIVLGSLMYIGYFIWWIIDLIAICTSNFKDIKGYSLIKD